MNEYVCESDGNYHFPLNSDYLNEVIEDLEQSLDVNKSLFKDIIQSKKSIHHQNSEESDTNLMISSKSLEIVQLENNRLIDAISRMTAEIAQSETLIAMSEERAKQSRVRRKSSHVRLQEEVKALKDTVQRKEEEIRKLEKYYSCIEDLLTENLKQETLNPSLIVEEGKKLIKKVTKQLDAAEALKDIEEKKCREAESEIKKIQGSLKVGSSVLTTTTDKILKKDYGMNLNYENFWFVGTTDEISDSIRSSASSVQDQQFPSKFVFSSKSKPKIPKLKFPLGGEKNEKNKDSPESKVSRLELAYQIKCEETQSLARVLSELQAIEDSLTKAAESIN